MNTSRGRERGGRRTTNHNGKERIGDEVENLDNLNFIKSKSLIDFGDIILVKPIKIFGHVQLY